MFINLILLIIAAGLGAILRFLASKLFNTNDFSYGTFIVNIVGCFLFGFLYFLFKEKLNIPENFKVIIFVGFLGSFTTFSTYIFESINLIENGKFMLSFLNISSQIVLGILFLYFGIFIGKSVIKIF
jgi:fluoride exporter